MNENNKKYQYRTCVKNTASETQSYHNKSTVGISLATKQNTNKQNFKVICCKNVTSKGERKENNMKKIPADKKERRL